MGIASGGKLLEAIEYFSSPEEIYNADKEALTECGMFNEKEIAYLEKKDMSFVAGEIERCNRERCYLVDYYSKFYPKALREIPEPPLMLYVKGSREALMKADMVTVAGSRSSDAYGVSVATSIGFGVCLKRRGDRFRHGARGRFISRDGGDQLGRNGHRRSLLRHGC